MTTERELLRKQMHKARASIKNKIESDKQIYKNLLELKCITEAQTVFCYVSTGHEIDTINIIKQLISKNKTVCVPKVNPHTNNMDAVKILSLDMLRPGYFKILEPVNYDTINKYNIDVAIVPALCFDRTGNRLGYGKGFYDRYLIDFKGKKIGLCNNECLVDNVYAMPHDIAVDMIVTQGEVINCRE